METLDELPDENGYSISENPDEFLQTSLDGGNPRSRLDLIGAERSVSLQWTGRKTRYEKLVSFFRENVGRNCEPFLIDLQASHAEYETYQARVVPQSVKMAKRGMNYTLSAQLRVIPTFDEYIGQTCDGGFQDGDGWPDVIPTDIPIPTGELIFFDKFNGVGSIDAHSPDIEPSGSASYNDTSTLPAELTGTALIVKGVPSAFAGQVYKFPLGAFETIAGRTFIEFTVSSLISGNVEFVVDFEFGEVGTNFMMTTWALNDGVASVKLEMNGNLVGTVETTYAEDITIRVEFENGYQNVFINGVSQDTGGTEVCDAVIGDGVYGPSFYIWVDGRHVTIPSGQGAVVDQFAFGKVAA